MNEIQIFDYNSQQVRTVIIDGEAWFVGKDVAEILGYADTWDALKKHVDDEDKQNLQNAGFETPRGLTVINKSGLYSLILLSRLPTAKQFKRWVTSKVLPSIEKHGAYIPPQAITDPDFIIRLAQELKAERQKVSALKEQQRVLEVKAAEDRPKVIFADAVDASDGSILIGNLAKILRQNGINIGQNRLFAWLRYYGYLMNCKGERWNMPTQSSIERGLFEVKKSVINNPDGSTRITHTTKVTGKGQIYFVNKFLAMNGGEANDVR